MSKHPIDNVASRRVAALNRFLAIRKLAREIERAAARVLPDDIDNDEGASDVSHDVLATLRNVERALDAAIAKLT